mmetsp:Transcript_22525/g.55609  ORF Transcript_22525/g.55609 Transcript_22525/m.55609 type:complete len:201 (+) Transcript_22525:714-1316(+)
MPRPSRSTFAPLLSRWLLRANQRRVQQPRVPQLSPAFVNKAFAKSSMQQLGDARNPSEPSSAACDDAALDKVEGMLGASTVTASAASSGSAPAATPIVHALAATPPDADESAFWELKEDMTLAAQSVDKLQLELEAQEMPLVTQAVNKMRLELMVQAQVTKLDTNAELARIRASIQRLMDEKKELNPSAAAASTSLVSIE